MNKLKTGFTSALFWLDNLATAFLVFILVSMWVFRDQVFSMGGALALVELIMLIGMIFILLFNIASLSWLGRRQFKNTHKRAFDSLLFGLGILCVVMMTGEKVMADEIAHETATGWNIQGEYLILYGMFSLQLVYNLLIYRRLFQRQQPESEARPFLPGR